MARLSIKRDGDGALSDLTDARTPEEVAVMRETGALIDLGDDDEIIVTGLEHGMQSGKASVAFGFKLPDGRAVIAQTSWRLFALAYQVLLGKLGEPDNIGLEVGHEGTGTMTSVVGDDEVRWMGCVVCGARKEFEPQSAPRSQPMEPMWWLREHFEREHPDHPRLDRAGVKRCEGHTWIAVPVDAPFTADKMCGVCGELRWDD